MTTPSATPLPAAAMRRVVSLVREQHAGPLTVGDLADEAGYSPFHFTRMFTASLGIPPGQYLTAHRMDAAKRLLLAGDDAVIDVATAVGFDSLSSFSRRFRETVGVPPAALRRLADQVADAPVRSFRRMPAATPEVRVRTRLPGELLASGTPRLWLGWYPQPAPFGLPAGGIFAELGEPLVMRLVPGAPWLLGFALPAGAGVRDQLVPERPVFALHPAPITSGGTLLLHFAPAPEGGLPLLSALPSLEHR